MDYTNDTVDASNAEIGMNDCNKEDAKPKSAGQLAHRFVHNFHVHETGEQTRCGTCGDEKVCLRCTHFGKKECETCGMFVSRNHFAKHRRVHSGERPFECGDCPASFKRKHHLEQHRRIHTGEQPFRCEKCGRNFRNKINRDHHLATVHSSARRHQCELCEKSYKRSDKLMEHKRRVHGHVYACPQCNETLRTRNEFTAHCETHTELDKHKKSRMESEEKLE